MGGLKASKGAEYDSGIGICKVRKAFWAGIGGYDMIPIICWEIVGTLFHEMKKGSNTPFILIPSS